MKYRGIVEGSGITSEIFSVDADDDAGAIFALRVLGSLWVSSPRRCTGKIPCISLRKITKEGKNFLDPEEESSLVATYPINSTKKVP